MSFFAAGLANLNAAARITYKMSKDGFFHRLLADTHEQNRTPHIAVMASSCLSLIIALALTAFNFPLLDIVGWLGTLATFGFIYAYVATSLSAAKLLRSINQFSVAKASVVADSIFVLAVSLIGSLYPAPPFPYNVLPFIFAAYMLFGWIGYRKLRGVIGETECNR